MNLKMIARAAGVSTATVSNVINGNHHKVSKETVARVQQIIREYDYKPNATARSLASRKSKIIGVVIPNVSAEDNFFFNPHDAHMLAYLEQYIRSQGYYMMMRSVCMASEILPLFAAWNVDGMICLGTLKSEIEAIVRNATVPTVFIDGYAEDVGATGVGIDDYKGGYLAGRYLTGKGHREIAVVSPEVNHASVVRERYQGFRDACEEKGVILTGEDHFASDTRYQSGVTAGQKIAMSGKKFTAVWAMSDVVAFGVMEGLRLCGLSIPGDVSVIGFDNLPECGYSYPKLTTISQNLEKKAEKAGKLLFAMLRGDPTEAVCEKNDVEIVERQSVKDLNL